MKRDTIESIKAVALICAILLSFFVIPKLFEEETPRKVELTGLELQAYKMYETIEEIYKYSENALKYDSGNADELELDLYHIYDMTEGIVLDGFSLD